MKRIIEKYGHIILAMVILLIYLSPNLFFQDIARILIHDNLDSTVVWYKNIVESPHLFGDNHAIVERTLNGIERGLYVSEYRVITFLYYLFPVQTAYHINIVIQHLVGFLGMFLLLKNYVFFREYNRNHYVPYIVVLIALGFGLLPFWPNEGIGISGQPLLFFILLRIYEEKSRWQHWLWLVIHPLYSELVVSGMFVVTLFTIYFIGRMIKEKTIKWKVFLAFFILTLLYILASYRLFQMRFSGEGEVGRKLAEFAYGSLYNYKGVIGIALQDALRGHYSYYAMSYPFIVSFVSLSFILLKKARKYIIAGIVVIFLLIIGEKIIFWDKLYPLVQKVEILMQVRLRWIAVLPFAWYVLYAVVVHYWVVEKEKYSYILTMVAGVNLFFVMFSIGDNYYDVEYAENAFYRTYFDSENEENNTFEKYYMTEQFEALSKVVPRGEKVGCLGFHPEIAQYNGYNTFGSYYVLRTKDYEELYLKALGGEAPAYVSSRLYLKSKELDSVINVSRDDRSTYTIKNLQLNFSTLKEEGVRYLLSSNPIESEHLEFIIQVGDDNTKKKIYVYKLK